MTQRTFAAESVRAAIDDYLNKTVTLEVISAQFGVSQQKFLDWCELDRQFRDKEVKKAAQAPAPMTFKLKDAMPETNYKQNRRHLKHRERILVYEARLAGGSVKAIAERFAISTATVINITKELKEYYANQPVTTPVAEPESEVKTQQVTVMEPIQINKAIDASDIGVFFEEDYLVLRIPKRSITQELLKGLL